MVFIIMRQIYKQSLKETAYRKKKTTQIRLFNQHYAEKSSKTPIKRTSLRSFTYKGMLYPKRDLNPHSHYWPKDFKSFVSTIPPFGQPSCGAENEARTRDPNLGKVMLYQLSYFRIWFLRVQR